MVLCPFLLWITSKALPTGSRARPLTRGRAAVEPVRR